MCRFPSSVAWTGIQASSRISFLPKSSPRHFYPTTESALPLSWGLQWAEAMTSGFYPRELGKCYQFHVWWCKKFWKHSSLEHMHHCVTSLLRTFKDSWLLTEQNRSRLGIHFSHHPPVHSWTVADISPCTCGHTAPSADGLSLITEASAQAPPVPPPPYWRTEFSLNNLYQCSWGDLERLGSFKNLSLVIFNNGVLNFTSAFLFFVSIRNQVTFWDNLE